MKVVCFLVDVTVSKSVVEVVHVIHEELGVPREDRLCVKEVVHASLKALDDGLSGDLLDEFGGDYLVLPGLASVLAGNDMFLVCDFCVLPEGLYTVELRPVGHIKDQRDILVEGMSSQEVVIVDGRVVKKDSELHFAVLELESVEKDSDVLFLVAAVDDLFPVDKTVLHRGGGHLRNVLPVRDSWLKLEWVTNWTPNLVLVLDRAHRIYALVDEDNVKALGDHDADPLVEVIDEVLLRLALLWIRITASGPSVLKADTLALIERSQSSLINSLSEKL